MAKTLQHQKQTPRDKHPHLDQVFRDLSWSDGKFRLKTGCVRSGALKQVCVWFKFQMHLATHINLGYLPEIFVSWPQCCHGPNAVSPCHRNYVVFIQFSCIVRSRLLEDCYFLFGGFLSLLYQKERWFCHGRYKHNKCEAPAELRRHLAQTST